jgi:hypothetical protein
MCSPHHRDESGGRQVFKFLRLCSRAGAMLSIALNFTECQAYPQVAHPGRSGHLRGSLSKLNDPDDELHVWPYDLK